MDSAPVPAGKEGILQDKHKRPESPAQAEDLALKSAAAYFGEELIQWLGIKEKVVRAVPTEMIELDVRHRYEDFLYEMENGSYYHFEFESDSITEKDLKRFREYEATTARIYNAPVITCVICSSKSRNIRNSITEGLNTYYVKVIRLKDENGDHILDQILQKPAEHISRENIIPVLFSPLMGGTSGIAKRIRKGIQVLKRAENEFAKKDIWKMEAIFYVFAAKFLEANEFEWIKEELAMTKLGQMMWDDALERGRVEGEEQASSRYSRLILLLNENNQTDQIIKAAADPEYRETLYRKYGI